jgi:hypothetical protein
MLENTEGGQLNSFAGKCEKRREKKGLGSANEEIIENNQGMP